MSDKKVVFSGVQPSGDLTIGNYIGAIRNFVEIQDTYDCYYCVVNQHAITVPQVAAELRRNTLDVLALYMACGIDPSKSTVFIQSHVPAHVELSWVLNSMAYMGELNRMTQFKEKSQRSDENLNAGLFTYPVLMAADILIYNANIVPVGDDQKQHLELARTLAERFNYRYSETFNIPEPLITKEGARIMSLQEPDKKMSKSDENKNGYILLLDEPNVIKNKIKRAVTDSKGVISYNDEQPGLKNLINIYTSFTNKTSDEIVKYYDGKGYGEFKEDLGNIVVESLKPIQNRYREIIKDKDKLEEIYIKGAEKASYKANNMLKKVYKKVGFI